MKLYFLNTCYACPEQYDVYIENGNQVAYVRLRWGNLSVSFPDVDGELIYEYNFEDNAKGIFDSDEERNRYLKEVSVAIKDKLLEKVNIDLEVEFKVFTNLEELQRYLA